MTLCPHSGGWLNFRIVKVKTKDLKSFHFVIGSWELDCYKKGTRLDKVFMEWKKGFDERMKIGNMEFVPPRL